ARVAALPRGCSQEGRARQMVSLQRRNQRCPMSMQPWRNQCRVSRKPSRRPRGSFLRLERLEDRLAPATWSGDVFDTTPGTPRWTNDQVQEISGGVHVPAGKTLSI